MNTLAFENAIERSELPDSAIQFTQVCGIPFALMLATIGICLAITFS